MKPNLLEKARRDGILVMAIRSGDEKAFVELKNCYTEGIYYMILKMVNFKEIAKELTEEAFEKAYANLSQYQLHYAFSSWLYRIAHNHAIDYLRRKSILKNYSLDSTGDISGSVTHFKGILIRSSVENPEESLIRKDIALLLRKMVSNLEPRSRILLEMHYFDEYSYSEITSELNLPISTIKIQLFRSRKLLYQLLRKSEISC